MGRIPVIRSDISASSGRTNAGVRGPRSSAGDFGAAGGAALQNLGRGVSDLAGGLGALRDRRRDEEVANRVATSDFTATELALRNEVGASGAGYQERTLEAYDDWVSQQADAIEDDAARTDFVNRMNDKRNAVSSRAATYEFTVAAEHSRDQANEALTSLDNKVRMSPDQYFDVLEQGEAVIDARADLPEVVRSRMKTTFRQGVALSRFEGELERAQTVDAVEALQAELEGAGETDWTKELSAAGLERVLSLTEAAATSVYTRADATARAAIDTIASRSSDVTSSVPEEELRAVQQLVDASQNPVTAGRMARIVRDEQIKRQARQLTPGQQRQVIAARYADPSLPPVLNTAINRAASLFGVSPAYLAATSKREYGQFLAGDPDSIDFGQGNAAGASSALGVMQFLEGTWLEVVNDPAFQSAAGVDVSGMSRAEKLALRGDVDVALLGGAFFTAQNARAAKAVLGREPNDAELYMMHFLGRGGGAQLFGLVKDAPNTLAADAFPEAAEANPTIFYDNGRARTAREVYEQLGSRHQTGDGSETYIEYGDRATRERVLNDTEQRVRDDPMGLASSVGVVVTGGVFEPGGMEARGQAARTVADYYSIPADQMKPFTPDEAAAIAQQFADGSADDVLGILTSIQSMEPSMARAAMAQIGNDSATFAYAGGLQMETGQGSVAAAIVKGQKRLDENPDVANQIGANQQDLSAAFLQATGGALFGAAPKQRQAVLDAAVAHYVETQVSRGAAGAFNSDRFSESVQAVLGATTGSPAIAKVNGAHTVLPAGVSAEAMESALDNMTVADWTSLSVQGVPPRYLTGEIADPRDLADEAQLQSIGGGQYRVLTSDGSFLLTGRPADNGQLEPYLFKPTAQSIERVNATAATARQTVDDRFLDEAARPETGTQEDDVAAANADGVISPEEQRLLVQKYGAQWAYDRNGVRLVPQQ